MTSMEKEGSGVGKSKGIFLLFIHEAKDWVFASGEGTKEKWAPLAALSIFLMKAEKNS